MASASEVFLTDLAFSEEDFVVTPAGDLDTMTGLDNLEAALMRRLLTMPGTLIHRPDYGLGIKQFQNAISSLATHRKIAVLINEQFIRDARVQSVEGIQVIPDVDNPAMTKILVKLKPVGYDEVVMEFIPFGEV
jgi:hypothetical protein